ncbi:MAG: hypothetical protein KJO91_11085 [Gammaproteobacteria bacterium]|nr:hypothetical protein [Gammaproteobacteria bacterium]
MRFSRLTFATLLVVIVSTTYVFVKETSSGARFRIANNSTQNVTVTANWLERSKDLGIVKAGSVKPITVRGEASMVFAMRYDDGREIESKPVYFTSGTTINISISKDSVDVSYDF